MELVEFDRADVVYEQAQRSPGFDCAELPRVADQTDLRSGDACDLGEVA